MFGVWAIVLLILLPALGLAILVEGLRQGRRRIHLLAHGDLTMGTIVACKVAHREGNGDDGFVPFDEFRAGWTTRANPRETGDQAADVSPTLQGARAFRIFSTAFGCLGVGLLVFGTLFGLVGMGMILFADNFTFNGRKLGPNDRLGPAMGILGFTILYDLVVLIILRGNLPRRMTQVASGTRTLADAFPEVVLDCLIELTSPDGAQVKAQEDGLRLDLARPDGPSVPVFQDPNRSGRIVVIGPRTDPFGLAPTATWLPCPRPDSRPGNSLWRPSASSAARYAGGSCIASSSPAKQSEGGTHGDPRGTQGRLWTIRRSGPRLPATGPPRSQAIDASQESSECEHKPWLWDRGIPGRPPSATAPSSSGTSRPS